MTIFIRQSRPDEIKWFPDFCGQEAAIRLHMSGGRYGIFDFIRKIGYTLFLALLCVEGSDFQALGED